MCIIKILSWWLNGKESTCQCRRCRFDLWVTKTPWRKKWQPTPVFLPGKFHGQRRLSGYNPWDCKESNMIEHTRIHIIKTSQGVGVHQFIAWLCCLYWVDHISLNMRVFVIELTLILFPYHSYFTFAYLIQYLSQISMVAPSCSHHVCVKEEKQHSYKYSIGVLSWFTSVSSTSQLCDLGHFI